MNQIVLGKFGGPFGVRGWIKLFSYTTPIDKIFDYLPWTIIKNHQEMIVQRVEGKIHKDHLIVQLPECQDREIAKTFTHLSIYVDRSQLPEIDDGSYYWADLIGLDVINRENQNLGRVESLFETGANDVIVAKEDNGKAHYIPYINDVILEVNLKNKIIKVDWGLDF